MPDPTYLFWSVIWGSVGLGYFLYGKKQRKVVPLFAGIGMMVIPYFIDGLWAMSLISMALIAIAYFVRME